MNDQIDGSIEAPGWFDAGATTFGDRLTGAREAADMTQAELARRLGIKVKTLRGWENDQAEPRANKLAMVSGLLGVSMMWLLSGEGDGIDSPESLGELPQDLQGVLVELRQLRSDQTRLAERTGRLEKRLRLAFAEVQG